MSQFEKEIEAKLSLLSEKAKIIFGVLTCEKLYPNYVAFEQRTGWGDNNLLLKAISLVHQHLINSDLISTLEIEDMTTRIDLITPDTEDFSDLTTSFALDACTAILSMLNFLINNDTSDIVDISTFAVDTVYAFIQLKEDFDPYDPSSDIQTDHNDFMLIEKQRQTDLINQLSKIGLDAITDDLIASLRNSRPIIDLSLLSE